MGEPTNIGFIFDLACALVYLIAVPLLLLIIFGPLMVRSLQKIQSQQKNQYRSTKPPGKLIQFFIKLFIVKNNCPRCGTKNPPDQEYCTQCGTSLRT